MEIIQDLIQKGRINRPGTENSRKYITIHDTANKKKGADAKAHATYLKTLNKLTSWHYTVDDECAYQHIPDSEKSYHTSRAYANENSIAIEICVNQDGDFSKAKENAVELVRGLMERYEIPVENICAHRDWTGKDCPAALVGESWNDFLDRCAKKEPEVEERFITLDELKAMGCSGIRW